MIAVARSCIVVQGRTQVMENDVNNVFISHIHEDDSRLPDLKNLLEIGGRTVRDSSINSEKPNNATSPDYIKSEILAPQIQWAGTLVVLVSPGTHESEWVNWEIEYAHKLGKRIVGVWDRGAAECDLPEKLDEYADAVVGWQAERIIDAIDGKTNTWETSTGEARAARAIARYQCD
jgi:hypothetical protein